MDFISASLLYSVDYKTNFKTNFSNLNKFSVHCSRQFLWDPRLNFLVFTANILALEYLKHLFLPISPDKPHPAIKQN